MTTETFMYREVREIPAATERLLSGNAEKFAQAGALLRQKAPYGLATIARGSSDHAATFLKYAIELTAGLPVASIGPSISSIYGREISLGGFAALAISQSGKSPDIIAMAEAARRSGALTLALTNTPDSPIAQAADITIDLLAGPERSVPATKSFVSSVVAGLAILGHWQQDESLLAALGRLPDCFDRAIACNWHGLEQALEGQQSLYVLGRGPAWAIAGEVALKFKEICGLHAEAYSAAEVVHGPVAIVGAGYPVLALAACDAAEASVVEVADLLAARGAAVFVTSQSAAKAQKLDIIATGHALTDALTPVVTFYSFVEQLARRRGLNPDAPRNLKKVTETR